MPRSKYFRHQARGEVFLLTSPFIGLGDKAGPICQIRGKSREFQRLAPAANLDDFIGEFNLTGEFNGGCTDSCCE
jgi:hypothetical protein